MLRTFPRPSWIFLLSAMFVLLLAQFQFTNWMEVHNDSLQALNEATDGVLKGTPHWRAYQNRVLSPAIVYVLGWFTWHPMTLFVQGAIILLDAALFVLVLRRTGSHLLALLVLMACTLLWVLEQHYWSYTWDFAEAAGWLALSWLALEGGTLRRILIVVAISAFNRESAMFMALFPIITGMWM
ncbi:MAG TPA: hypothetical protein VFW93_12570, partial [Aquabacterium sp.]|uniref:hypothetical protein n=1 Tax=Aquabacterium sp. TaxID=1872578 RepID=UPI002E304240